MLEGRSLYYFGKERNSKGGERKEEKVVGVGRVKHGNKWARLGDLHCGAFRCAGHTFIRNGVFLDITCPASKKQAINT